MSAHAEAMAYDKKARECFKKARKPGISPADAEYWAQEGMTYEQYANEAWDDARIEA